MRVIASDKDMYRIDNNKIQGISNSRLFTGDATLTEIRLDGL